MGVSSRESWAYRLTDGTGSYWQSCGTQGKYLLLIILELPKLTLEKILNSNLFTIRQTLDKAGTSS
jgi:hypothetical protein